MFLVVSIICVPIMLCIKPAILISQLKKENKGPGRRHRNSAAPSHSYSISDSVSEGSPIARNVPGALGTGLNINTSTESKVLVYSEVDEIT